MQLQPQHADYAQIRRAVAAGRGDRRDVVFNWDHFFPLYGEPEGKHFECWTMLGAWAEATERVEIGALVTCNSYRNPQLLADMARTVDHISDGRLILGIGSGWFEKDYDEYGYEFGTAGGRLDALDRDLPLITERLGRLNPAPTRHVPVLVGGGGERKTLRIVAQNADIWHGFGDVDDHRPQAPRARRLVRARWAATRWRSSAPRACEAQDAAASAESLYAVGTRLFTVGVGGPDYDLGPLRDLVAWRDRTNAAKPAPPSLSGCPSPKPQTLLVTVSGDDRPGVTSALFNAIADVGAEVLDLEQVVVRGHLTLALLLAAGPRDDLLRSVVRDVAAGLGMKVKVRAGTGDNAPRRSGRAAVVVLGAPLLASAVAAVTARIAAHGANIDRIRRLSRYPVTTVEFDVSGADVASLRRELALEAAVRGVDIAVAACRPGPPRPAPGRHGRRLHPDPGRGDRAAGRPRGARGGGRRGDGGGDARRARLRREPAGTGRGARRAAGERARRGAGRDPC